MTTVLGRDAANLTATGHHTKQRLRSPQLRFAAKRSIDLETLQAVTAHRYDALAKFLKALPRLAAEEFAFLKVDARDGRLLRRLLKQDASATLPEA